MHTTAPTRSTSRIVAARLLAAVVIVWMIVIAARWGRLLHHVVDFHPINGSFQTFDPIRRMQAGQWPGRDFDVYLGLGPVHVTRFATAVFGETFHASLVGTVAACVLLHALLVGALARLAGASRLTCVIFAALGLSMGLALDTAWMPNAWIEALRAVFWPVAAPGNSLLGLRAFAPLVSIGVLAFALRFGLRGQGRFDGASATSPWKPAAVWVGVAAGIVFPWSNDYGPVTWLAVLVGAVTFAPSEWVAGRRVAFATVSFVASLIVAALVATIATGGAPLRWFDYNVNGVARDQAWYFHVLDGATQVDDPGARPYVVGAIASIASWALARRTRRLGDAGIAICVAATFGAGAIASHSAPSERYFQPLYHLLWVAAPLRAATSALEWVRARASERPRRFLSRAVGVSLGLACLAAATEPTRRLVIAPDPTETSVRFGVEVPAAGGTLPGKLEKIVWTADRIREECERDHVPVDRRLVSTYVTMLDLLLGTLGPSGDDYLIHALGRERRTRFVDRLRELEPRFVTTIRDDFTPYERWLRKQDWDVYAEVFAHYDPWQRLPYAIVWRRRDTARASSSCPVAIERSAPDARGAVTLSISIDPACVGSRTQIVEVELRSSHGLVPGGGAFPPSSTFACAVERDATDRVFEVGLPPDEPTWRLSVEVSPGAPTRLEIVPPTGHELSLDSVVARVVIAKDAVDDVRLSQLVATSYTSARYELGIARGDHEAAFLLMDPTDLAAVEIGDRLRFASSGERRIVAIADRRVTVDGPPLSPRGDGYPHAVDVLPR